jgi:hypothetical protein
MRVASIRVLPFNVKFSQCSHDSTQPAASFGIAFAHSTLSPGRLALLGKLRLILIFLLLPVLGFAQEKRFEAGTLFTGSLLREIGSRDSGPGTEVAGYGGRFVYRASRFVDLESEVNFLPGNSATSGNHIQGLFGAKAGLRFSHGGVFLKARPGFMHFRRDPFGVGKPGTTFFLHERASSTEPSLDLGTVVEPYTRRGLILRFDVGQTLVRYAPRTVRTSDFLPPREAGGFGTQNWQASLGFGWRF